MGKALKTAGAIIGGAVLMATGVGALAGLQVTAMGIAGLGTMSVASLQLTSAGLMAAGAMLDKPKSTASGSPSDWNSRGRSASVCNWSPNRASARSLDRMMRA